MVNCLSGTASAEETRSFMMGFFSQIHPGIYQRLFGFINCLPLDPKISLPQAVMERQTEKERENLYSALEIHNRISEHKQDSNKEQFLSLEYFKNYYLVRERVTMIKVTIVFI